VASRSERRKDVIYVYNQADSEGFHAIKNEKGDIIATACDTEEQARITLDVMGLVYADIETVYDQKQWDSIGYQRHNA
jgi:hypothetical protein